MGRGALDMSRCPTRHVERPKQGFLQFLKTRQRGTRHVELPISTCRVSFFCFPSFLHFRAEGHSTCRVAHLDMSSGAAGVSYFKFLFLFPLISHISLSLPSLCLSLPSLRPPLHRSTPPIITILHHHLPITSITISHPRNLHHHSHPQNHHHHSLLTSTTISGGLNHHFRWSFSLHLAESLTHILFLVSILILIFLFFVVILFFSIFPFYFSFTS